jgi:hypothetical protein
MDHGLSHQGRAHVRRAGEDPKRAVSNGINPVECAAMIWPLGSGCLPRYDFAKYAASKTIYETTAAANCSSIFGDAGDRKFSQNIT